MNDAPLPPAGARRSSAGLDPLALGVLALGVACVSTAAPLIRSAQAPALGIAAYRLVLASAVVIPLSLARDRAGWRALARTEVGRMAAAGLCLAVHFALWIASLDLTSVASSVVLVTTTPLWVGLAAPVVVGETVSRRLLGAILVAFLGGALIGGGDLSTGREALQGDLLAVGGALAAASYFLIGRQVRPRVSLITYVALTYGSAALALTVLAVGTGTPLRGYDTVTWRCLVLLALVPQLLGHSSFNWALRRLSVTFVTGTVLGEAIGSSLLAWWLLGEAPSRQAVLGGALVLAGLVIAAGAESASSLGRGTRDARLLVPDA